MICWIAKTAQEAMRVELHRKFPLETGGVLVGYIGANGDRVVTQVIGPGPKAKHERYNFEPDHEFQNKAIGIIWDATQGKETYLGDWHTHPGGPCWPSELDCQCLAKLSKSKEARTPQPLMVILGTDPMTTGAYVLLNKVQRIDIQEFTP